MGGKLVTGKKVLIEGRKYKIKRRLGEGGHAYVFLVKDKKTNDSFALKQSNIEDDEMLSKLEKEASIMRMLSPHLNIVGYKSSLLHDKKGKRLFFLLTEFCEGGSLLEKINEMRKTGQTYSEKNLLEVFNEICRGVQHMHTQDPPIFHRDLKVENVLIKGEQYKICDFGSCTSVVPNLVTLADIHCLEDDIEKYTTAEYRAPEMFDLHQRLPIDDRVDIWALGCVLYTLAFQTHPFTEGKLQILNGKYTIPTHSKYSPEISNLIRVLLTRNPIERPRINAVLEMVQQCYSMSISTHGVDSSEPWIANFEKAFDINLKNVMMHVNEPIMSPLPHRPPLLRKLSTIKEEEPGDLLDDGDVAVVDVPDTDTSCSTEDGETDDEVSSVSAFGLQPKSSWRSEKPTPLTNSSPDDFGPCSPVLTPTVSTHFSRDAALVMPPSVTEHVVVVTTHTTVPVIDSTPLEMDQASQWLHASSPLLVSSDPIVASASLPQLHLDSPGVQSVITSTVTADDSTPVYHVTPVLSGQLWDAPTIPTIVLPPADGGFHSTVAMSDSDFFSQKLDVAPQPSPANGAASSIFQQGPVSIEVAKSGSGTMEKAVCPPLAHTVFIESAAESNPMRAAGVDGGPMITPRISLEPIGATTFAQLFPSPRKSMLDPDPEILLLSERQGDIDGGDEWDQIQDPNLDMDALVEC